MDKKHRLLKNWDFKNVINKKQRAINDSFALYFYKNDDWTKVGISVSKKLGNAVFRNKTKRQIRSMCREVFSMEKKFDIVLIAQKNYLKNDYETNLNNLKKLKQKAGL